MRERRRKSWPISAPCASSIPIAEAKGHAGPAACWASMLGAIFASASQIALAKRSLFVPGDKFSSACLAGSRIGMVCQPPFASAIDYQHQAADDAVAFRAFAERPFGENRPVFGDSVSEERFRGGAERPILRFFDNCRFVEAFKPASAVKLFVLSAISARPRIEASHIVEFLFTPLLAMPLLRDFGEVVQRNPPPLPRRARASRPMMLASIAALLALRCRHCPSVLPLRMYRAWDGSKCCACVCCGCENEACARRKRSIDDEAKFGGWQCGLGNMLLALAERGLPLCWNGEGMLLQ